MYRRDYSSKDYPSNTNQNYDGRGRWTTDSNSRPNQSRWDRSQNTSHHFRYGLSDRNNWYNRNQSPPKTDVFTKEACDSSTDISKSFSRDDRNVSPHVKSSDVRHLMNSRRHSYSDRESSSGSTSKNLSQPSISKKSLHASKDKSYSEALKNSPNHGTKPLPKESYSAPKAGSSAKSNIVSSIKTEIIEVNTTEETPRSQTNSFVQKISNKKHQEPKTNEKNQTTQRSSKTPNTTLAEPSTSSPCNLVNSIKQEIIEDNKIANTKDRTINPGTHLSNLNQVSHKNVANSLFGSPKASSTPKSVPSKPSSSLNVSSKISVKSVEEMNRMNETHSINESSLSIVESTQPHLSTSHEEPTSSKRARDKSVTVHTTIEALTCNECETWTYSDKVFWCECRIVCRSCKKKNNICNLCDAEFITDARLVNFHKRIASTVPHPCRYQPCSQTVRPGVAHEETCPYVPTKCFKCKKFIATACLQQHYDEKHPRQVLSDENYDVKFSDFMKVEGGGDCRHIHSSTQKQLILIALNKVGDKRDFMVTPLQVTHPTNIIVTFEFKFKSYEFKKEVKVSNDSESALGTVDLPSDILQDWEDQKCKLNIMVLLKKKRVAENKPPKKKRKLATDAVDGSS